MIRARLIRLSAIILSVLAVTIFWGIYRADRVDDPSTASSSHIIPSTAAFTDTAKNISIPSDANPLSTNILALPSTAATQPAQFRPALPAIPVPPPIVVPFEWPEYPFSGKLIAAEPNSPSFTVLDFTEKVMKIYPLEHHHLFGPLDDVMLTTQGDMIVVTSQTVFFLPEADLSSEPVILRPSKSITLPGFPAHLSVLPDRSGSSIWIVQTSNKNRRETHVDLVNIESGTALLAVVLREGGYMPVGTLDDQLVLVGDDNLLLLANDGSTEHAQACHDMDRGNKAATDGTLLYIAAAYNQYIVCLIDNYKSLLIVDVETDHIHELEAPDAGTWAPFDFPGLLDIGTPMTTRSNKLAIGLYPAEDQNLPVDEQRWSLYEITLDDQRIYHIIDGQGQMPKAVYLGDHILAAWRWPDSRIHIINRGEHESMSLLTYMPENHTVFDAAIIAR